MNELRLRIIERISEAMMLASLAGIMLMIVAAVYYAGSREACGPPRTSEPHTPSPCPEDTLCGAVRFRPLDERAVG